MKIPDILETLQAERAEIAPEAGADLTPLRLAAEDARLALQEFRESPDRPQNLSADDRAQALALDGALQRAGENLRAADQRQRVAARRLREIDALLTADENARTAGAALAAIRSDGEQTEGEIGRTVAAIERIETELIDLEQRATARADQAAETALSGAALQTKDNGPAEIAARQSALVGLARRRDALSGKLAELGQRAADARQRLLIARHAQAQLAYDAALLTFGPHAERLVAAGRALGGIPQAPTLQLDEGRIEAATVAALQDCGAWRPTLAAVAEPAGNADGDMIEERRAA